MPIPEPADRAFAAWYVADGSVYVVLQRDDASTDDDNTEARWWKPTGTFGTDNPRTWAEACTDLAKFRGPVVLVPADGGVSS